MCSPPCCLLPSFSQQGHPVKATLIATPSACPGTTLHAPPAQMPRCNQHAGWCSAGGLCPHRLLDVVHGTEGHHPQRGEVGCQLRPPAALQQVGQRSRCCLTVAPQPPPQLLQLVKVPGQCSRSATEEKVPARWPQVTAAGLQQEPSLRGAIVDQGLGGGANLKC
eukprot:1158084-Pelagomonas_calceolata.AAC.11